MTVKSGRFSTVQLLGFMADAVSRILESTSALSKAEFMADNPAGRQVRDAVIYNIGMLGEAANDLAKQYPEFVASRPDLPAQALYRMRNLLVHEYHSINMEIVWSTCREAVPVLAKEIQRAITSAASGDQ